MNRIVFICSPAVYLKCKMAIRISLSNIIDHDLLNMLKILIFNLKHRTDPGNAEHMLQSFNDLIIVIISLCLNINPASLLGCQKSSLYSAQSIFNLLNQSILKQIPVFSFCSDLCVLN